MILYIPLCLIDWQYVELLGSSDHKIAKHGICENVSFYWFLSNTVCDHCSPCAALGFSDILDVWPHFLKYISEQTIVAPPPIIASTIVKMATTIHMDCALHESSTTDVACLWMAYRNTLGCIVIERKVQPYFFQNSVPKDQIQFHLVKN